MNIYKTKMIEDEWTASTNCWHCGKKLRKNSKSNFCCTKHAMFYKLKHEELKDDEGAMLAYHKFSTPISMSKNDTLKVTWKIVVK